MTGLRAALLVLTLTGCGRGCDAPPIAAVGPPVTKRTLSGPRGRSDGAKAPTPPRQPVPRSDADRAETSLRLTLPRRTQDDPFPGFSTLPRRRLRGFDPSRHLLATLRGDVVTLLGRTAHTTDPKALDGIMRAAIESWGERSGVAATRIVLVVARDVNAESAAALRMTAIGAHRWRVVTLARERGDLMEVQLSPPGKR